jgi:hypothetical protein
LTLNLIKFVEKSYEKNPKLDLESTCTCVVRE